MDAISRDAAAGAGLTKYYTGVSCKHGHDSFRWVKSGACVVCAKKAGEAWAAQQPKEKLASYTQKYKEKNKETVLAKDREYKAWLRVQMPDKVKADKRRSYAKKAASEGRAVRQRWQPLDSAEFMRRALETHGGKFTYDLATYRGMHHGVRCFCLEHQEGFVQTPQNHLRGAVGCHKCNHMKSSTEDAVAAFLGVFAQVARRDREIVKPCELDIVLPEKRLAIEVCGEYYHSSGDIESEVRMSTKHIGKFKAAAKAGYRLITVFESEWLGRRHAIKRLLRNAIGKGRGKVMARKCELRKVEHADARAFYERYHPQGGAGHGVHYGLFWIGKLVACMRFTEGVNDRGVNAYRVWTLSRYATRVTVAGGASRLFAAFVKEHNPRTVKSFSDNRFFAGGMYAHLGFSLRDEGAADYMVWHQKIGLLHKAKWQRREIQARAAQLGMPLAFDHETDPRTERDMTYLLGGRRVYDCGKKTWVWGKS